MSGIVFLKTENLDGMRQFYVERIGMDVWLEQAECVILRHGNLLLGFCEREPADRGGCCTFFYDTRSEVDDMYERFKDAAMDEPKVNERYNIYNFFAKDPEGRTVEFQSFLHDVEPYLSSDELLLDRRSIRNFKNENVSDELLMKVVELSRFAPSARNSEPCYFKAVRDAETIKNLAGVRNGASAPIGRAPMATAVCADPEMSRRYVQDGCIAAYHFILAAKTFGLGTCWIADMDRNEVKEMLEIPFGHYIATVTPLGYPDEDPFPPKRKDAKDLIQYL